MHNSAKQWNCQQQLEIQCGEEINGVRGIVLVSSVNQRPDLKSLTYLLIHIRKMLQSPDLSVGKIYPNPLFRPYWKRA